MEWLDILAKWSIPLSLIGCVFFVIIGLIFSDRFGNVMALGQGEAIVGNLFSVKGITLVIVLSILVAGIVYTLPNTQKNKSFEDITIHDMITKLNKEHNDKYELKEINDKIVAIYWLDPNNSDGKKQIGSASYNSLTKNMVLKRKISDDYKWFLHDNDEIVKNLEIDYDSKYINWADQTVNRSHKYGKYYRLYKKLWFKIIRTKDYKELIPGKKYGLYEIEFYEGSDTTNLRNSIESYNLQGLPDATINYENGTFKLHNSNWNDYYIVNIGLGRAEAEVWSLRAYVSRINLIDD